VDIFFGDESTQKGGRTGMGKLVSFGGVFVSDVSLRPFTEDVDRVAKKYGLPDGTEFKWSPPRDNWIRDNLTGDDRVRCYQEVLDVAKTHNARAVVYYWTRAERPSKRTMHFRSAWTGAGSG
jgi:hypothetical protein